MEGRGTGTGQWRCLRREKDIPGDRKRRLQEAIGAKGVMQREVFSRVLDAFQMFHCHSQTDVRDSSCLACCRNLRSGALEAEIQARQYESVPLRLPSLPHCEVSACAPVSQGQASTPSLSYAEPTKQRFPSSPLTAELFLVLLR